MGWYSMNRYPCRIQSEKQVYDGDTIKDVRIEVNIPALEVGFYLVRDIRIFGIDTPEKRPRKAGRTPESRANEKAAANRARAYLIGLLSDNDFQSELMIQAGHAKPYDGGTKPDWNW